MLLLLGSMFLRLLDNLLAHLSDGNLQLVGSNILRLLQSFVVLFSIGLVVLSKTKLLVHGLKSGFHTFLFNF